MPAPLTIQCGSIWHCFLENLADKTIKFSMADSKLNCSVRNLLLHKTTMFASPAVSASG